ncbi:MAG: hypothetical protein RPU60_02660 [Candidatus Sedimenticola sp. (ex Thyasira tokunagai)]
MPQVTDYAMRPDVHNSLFQIKNGFGQTLDQVEQGMCTLESLDSADVNVLTSALVFVTEKLWQDVNDLRAWKERIDQVVDESRPK